MASEPSTSRLEEAWLLIALVGFPAIHEFYFDALLQKEAVKPRLRFTSGGTTVEDFLFRRREEVFLRTRVGLEDDSDGRGQLVCGLGRCGSERERSRDGGFFFLLLLFLPLLLL